MSFTTEVKNEICSLEFSKLEAAAFLSGFVRNNLLFSSDKLVLIDENLKVIRKIFSLIKELYDVNIEIEQGKTANFGKKNCYSIIVSEKLNYILNDLNVTEGNSVLKKPNAYFLDSDDCIKAYLSGVFVAVGSINDPKKSRYHLEFLVNNMFEAELIIDLISRFGIVAKVINRDIGYMVYVKEAEKIGDFLRIVGVNRAVMYYEDIRIFRNQKNMTNRLNNCEQANVDKIIASCNRQLNDINVIINNLGIDLVDEKTKEVIEYRLKYPEASLEELSKIISYETEKELTKSGLNHRMRKIHDLAMKLNENKKG